MNRDQVRGLQIACRTGTERMFTSISFVCVLSPHILSLNAKSDFITYISSITGALAKHRHQAQAHADVEP